MHCCGGLVAVALGGVGSGGGLVGARRSRVLPSHRIPCYYTTLRTEKNAIQLISLYNVMEIIL